MKDVVIVGLSARQSAVFRGALSRHSAVELGSPVVQALVERSGVQPQDIDEVIPRAGVNCRSRAESCAPVGH